MRVDFFYLFYTHYQQIYTQNNNLVVVVVNIILSISILIYLKICSQKSQFSYDIILTSSLLVRHKHNGFLFLMNKFANVTSNWKYACLKICLCLRYNNSLSVYNFYFKLISKTKLINKQPIQSIIFIIKMRVKLQYFIFEITNSMWI